MNDFLEACLDDISGPGGDRDYRAFQETFCARCRNPQCVHAKWAKDRFSARVSTQVDRFFNPNRAEQGDPRYAQITDFQNLLREALRLEVSARKGDWSVPEIPITDGLSEVAHENTTNAVDTAVRNLARAKGGEEPDLPDPAEAFVEEAEALLEESPKPPPNPTPPMSPLRPASAPPKPGNTAPREGIMIGGGPAPKPPAPPPGDPWAPKPVVQYVKPGAVIQMGGEEKKDG